MHNFESRTGYQPDIEQGSASEVVQGILNEQAKKQRKDGRRKRAQKAVDGILDSTRAAIDDQTQELHPDQARELESKGDDVLRDYEKQVEKTGVLSRNKDYYIGDLSDVETAAGRGASGIYEPGQDRTTIHNEVLDPNLSEYTIEFYHKGTCPHEDAHQELQAKEWNADKLLVDGKEYNLQTLIEGQAVHAERGGNPNLEEHSPEYRRFANDFADLTSRLGRDIVYAAMKSGDLQGLQKKIDAGLFDKSRPDAAASEADLKKGV